MVQECAHKATTLAPMSFLTKPFTKVPQTFAQIKQISKFIIRPDFSSNGTRGVLEVYSLEDKFYPFVGFLPRETLWKTIKFNSMYELYQQIHN